MAVKINVPSGTIFGRLTVMREDEPSGTRKRRMFLCMCACGVEKTISLDHMRQGKIVSCGCFHTELLLSEQFAKSLVGTHGGQTDKGRRSQAARDATRALKAELRGKSARLARHPLRRTYKSMLARCYNKSHTSYAAYGGRGIKVCKRWLRGVGDKTGFECFLEDMGPRPKGKSIDRKDNNKGYSPNNCSWASRIQQQNNTRRNVTVTWDGMTRTVAQWSRALNIPDQCLRDRLNRGWTIKRALTQPARSWGI